MNRKLTASLLILAAVLANLGFTALGSIFNYPDVLDEPAGEVLAEFRDHQGAVSAWFAVLALSAALLAPIAIGVGRLSSRARDADRGAGRHRRRGRAGHRPAALADPRARLRVRRGQRRRRVAATAATRSRPRATSSAPRSARRSATCSPPPGRCSSSSRSAGASPGAGSRCWAALSAALVFVGVFSPLGLPVIDTANFFGYVLWSVWLIAFGVVILVHERRATPRRRRAAAVTS